MSETLAAREDDGERPIKQWKAARACLTCGGRTVSDLTKAWRICVDCGEEWPVVAYTNNKGETK